MQSSFNIYKKKYPSLKKFEENIHLLIAEGYFNNETPILINRTPGRLDLMGGNDDYTGGLVFEKTIREATMVALQERSDTRILLYNPTVRKFGWDDHIDLSLEDLRCGDRIRPMETVRDWINTNPARSWCAYLIGDIYFLLDHYSDKITHGFTLYLESEIPLGKGVSSSAALEVAGMKVMAACYGIDVRGIELATWTQWVEIMLTQAACGIMDQLTVVMGEEDYFVPMLCQPCQLYPLVKLPENLTVWGIDSDVRHAVSGIEYETSRAATFMGYHYLCEWEKLKPQLDKSGVLPRWVDPKWNGYLANIMPSTFRNRYEERLPFQEEGGSFNKKYPIHLDPFTKVLPEIIYPVRGATRYAVEENWRVHVFFNLISKSREPIDLSVCKLLGELMYQSHQGYNDCGLGSPYTDKIVELVRLESKQGLFGAKITGGGAGGTVAVMGENSLMAQQAVQRVVQRYCDWCKKDAYIFEGSSAGCDVFGVIRISNEM